MPAWIAALTHVIYGVTLGLLQPLGRFVPYRPVSPVSPVTPVSPASAA